jgi:hypothetical protein
MADGHLSLGSFSSIFLCVSHDLILIAKDDWHPRRLGYFLAMTKLEKINLTAKVKAAG